MKILFVGENWYGSCARACCAALRRLNCEVLELDTQTCFPQWEAPELKAARRLLSRRIGADFSAQVLAAADMFQPEMLLAFKGSFLNAKTLRSLRRQKIRLYNYYPDRVIFIRGTELERSLPEYDCVFDTKRGWDGDMPRRLHLQALVFIPHGYDPEIHEPVKISASESAACPWDVSFVGTHTKRKERLLSELIETLPGLRLRIFGSYWNRCGSVALRKLTHGSAVRGQGYARVICSSRINLAIMGVSDDAFDETTTRTFEIPACGGFMLHERTDEVLGLYAEDREIACFGSASELADKVNYYLKNPSEARRIAEAGHHRTVPQYSYDNRMKQILAYHQGCAGTQLCVEAALDGITTHPESPVSAQSDPCIELA